MSPTRLPSQTISGTKPLGTAILDHGVAVVPADDQLSWSYELKLEPGDNYLALTSARPSGLSSRETTTATVVYEPPCPETPTLVKPDRYTQLPVIPLSGTKGPMTSVWLNGAQIVDLSSAKQWEYQLALGDVDGDYDFVVTARNHRGHESDPLRFAVTLDAKAPELSFRYPEPESQDAPTNALVWVHFGGAIQIEGTAPPQELLIVEQGGVRVPGSLSYLPGSGTVVWVPMAGVLTAQTEYSVQVDSSLVIDLAGNIAQDGPDLTWTFTTTVGAELQPPMVPTVDNQPVAAVQAPSLELFGSKGSLVGIYVNGQQVIAPTRETTWRYDLPLPVGTTSVAIGGRSATDLASETVDFVVERVVERPAPPELDAQVPTEVAEPLVHLVGRRPEHTSVLLDGNAIVCAGMEPEWMFDVGLQPGANELNLQSRSEEGVVSESLLHTVNYAQQYQGLVPEGFELQVEFELRDLSKVAEIRGEFSTGPNNYAVDAWVEGPIELGAVCDLVDGQRRDIKYVATITHYIGSKAQHKVPFADEDYRGTDYLASLISAGVFEFLGLNPGSPRRRPNGRELPGLLSGVTEESLRRNIDCFGSPFVDICTRATRKSGAVQLGPWTPRQRNGNGRLEQGDYLLFVQLNLDRNGAWLVENDFETCWSSPDDRNRGMHRMVRRISLGKEPYVLDVPQSEELSGPDREGAGRLHYIGGNGVTIRWGPNN